MTADAPVTPVAPPAPDAPPARILLRMPNWLGDLVMALPTLRALRTWAPNARIDVACRSHLTAALAGDPSVNAIHACPAGRGIRRLWALWRAGGALRRERYDLGILLPNSFASALWLWRTGARRRVGYARDGRGFLLSTRVAATDARKALHMRDYYLALVEAAAGGTVSNPTDRALPSLHVPKAGRDQAQARRAAWGVSGPYAVLAPMSAYGPVKDWPGERYAAVARGLIAEGMTVLLTGTGGQREGCAAIAAQCDDPRESKRDEQGVGRGGVINAAGATDLAGFLGLLAEAALFVGGDSGGAHAAAALARPTVVIWGITEPSRTRALGPAVVDLGSGGLETPDLDDPEIQRQARAALEAISPEAVLAAATEARRHAAAT